MKNRGTGEPGTSKGTRYHYRMESLSDIELDNEREKARLDYIKSGSRTILDLFDEVIRKRKYGDEEPGFPVHSEQLGTVLL